MEVKQAHGAARAMVRALRDFQDVEEVLDAAVAAKQAQVAVEERIRVLSASAKKWEGAVEEARARYTAEQISAGTEMERLATRAVEALTAQEREHREALTQADREIKSALTAGELARKQITAKCRSLEERGKELEGKLRLAREDYAAFREKVGAS